jgi:hypothetical protein
MAVQRLENDFPELYGARKPVETSQIIFHNFK